MDYDEDKIIKAKLTTDFLKTSVYWSICKFKMDDYKREQSSSKQALLGDFIDRWMNKAPEFLIFNEILKDKKYNVINDNYFYNDNKAKHAPDIIGLKDNQEKKYPFAIFKNNEWELIEDTPFIEMKTFRNNQKLITIPINQFADNHYYVIVESHLKEDYLLYVFDEELFNNDKYYNHIISQYEQTFIKSNEDNIIVKPKKIELSGDLGYYQLLGIYKGKELKEYGKIIEQGDRPLYFYEEVDAPNTPKRYEINPHVELESGLYHFDNNEENIPCFIDIDENSQIEITHKTKDTINVFIKGKVKIDGILLSEGYRRLKFRVFEKNGSAIEFATTKSIVQYLNSKISSTEELIYMFDSIVE